MVNLEKKLNEILKNIPCVVMLNELPDKNVRTEDGKPVLVRGRISKPYNVESTEQSFKGIGRILLELWADSSLSTKKQYQYTNDCRIVLHNEGILTTSENIGKDRETSDYRLNVYFNYVVE